MRLHRNSRVLAVAALGLLLLSIVSVNQARVQMGEVCDHRATGNSCLGEREPATQRSLETEDSDYTTRRASQAFEVDDEYAYVVAAAGICSCTPPSPLDPEETVKVHVEGPGGRMYGPWDVTYDEPCHSNCVKDSPGGVEQIVMVSPPLGSYTIILEPGPGRSRLPDNSNVIRGYAQGFFALEKDDDFLRGNNIWWYYPDGSKVFVEDGGYVWANEVEQAFGVYAGVAVVLWVLAGYSGYAALRVRPSAPQRPHQDPILLVTEAVALVLLAVALGLSSLWLVKTSLEYEPPLGWHPVVDWGFLGGLVLTLLVGSAFLVRRAVQLSQEVREAAHHASSEPPRLE